MQFLDNLDSFEGGEQPAPAPAPTSASAAKKVGAGGRTAAAKGSAGGGSTAAAASSSTKPGDAANPEDAQSVLDFLDEIVTSRDNRTRTTPSALTPGAAGGQGQTAGLRGSSADALKRPPSSSPGISRSGSRTALRDDGATTGVSASTRKSTDSARSLRSSYLTPANSAAAQASEKLQEAAPAPTPAAAASSPPSGATGGWGWGSVWSQASNVIQQARTVAEEQVSKNLNHLPASISSLQSQLPVSPSSASQQGAAALSNASEQAQKWRSGVLNMLSSVDVEKLRREITETGLKAMNDIMNTVAPPIAEHEVIQVNLSHDMVGYEGVETLVYRALAKIMEEVEGGDLVVNKGMAEDLPSAEKQAGNSGAEEDDDRNLNTVDGFVEGYKLAEANLEALIKRHYKKPEAPIAGESSSTDPTSPSSTQQQSSITLPVTICPVYMRIQPVLAPLPFSTTAAPAEPSTSEKSDSSAATAEDPHLFFILILRDPTNELVHKTLTQSMPSKWLDIPFEENEWVEDIMVQIIRSGVEIIGQEYVKGRTYGRLLKNAKNEGGSTLFNQDDEVTADEGSEKKEGV